MAGCRNTHPSEYGEEAECDGALHVVGGTGRRVGGLAPRIGQVAEAHEVQERPERWIGG